MGTQAGAVMTERQALPTPYYTHPFGREMYTDEQMHAYARECVVAATSECSAAWQAKLDAAVVVARMDGVHSVHAQTAVIVRAALELLEAVEGCEGFPPEKMAAFRRVFGA